MTSIFSFYPVFSVNLAQNIHRDKPISLYKTPFFLWLSFFLSITACHPNKNATLSGIAATAQNQEPPHPSFQRCQEFTENAVSIDEANQLSQQAYFYLLKQYGTPLVDLPEGINQLHQDLFKMVVNLASRSQRPYDPENNAALYRISILPSPEINAFSLAGGDIVVTLGFLIHQYQTGNENQVAEVLGHEIWHIINKDSLSPWKDIKYEVCTEIFKPNAKPEFKELQPGFQAALDTSCKGAINLNHTEPKVVKRLTERFVEKLICGSYDQELELRADDEGLRLAILAGYRPDYKNLFANLKPVHGFANHPSYEKRIQNLDLFIQSLKSTPDTFGYADSPFTNYTLLPVAKEFSILEQNKPIAQNTPWERICMAKKL